MSNKIEYNVKLSVRDFHLVFGTLQDKMLSNQDEMKSMVTYENLYDMVISDEEKYKKLEEESEYIRGLLRYLYDETNEQLKEQRRN